jgi:hypothetical protein
LPNKKSPDTEVPRLSVKEQRISHRRITRQWQKT